tara:strand:- start:1432 stop:2229 length:798 start_codon:yes stop_codon:yes gene_type:complete
MITGCSFSAPSDDPVLLGTSWGEKLAAKLDWDLVHLARQGMSNGGIRIMIDEILRQKPDFAIVAPTFHDRIEIPGESAPYIAPENENKGWGSDLQDHLQTDHGAGYDPSAGVDNVNWGNNNYRMISETIFSLAENYDHHYRSQKLDRATNKAVKQYINHMYDNNWKLQQDKYIIGDGIFRLHHAGIPFLLVACNIYDSATVRDQFPQDIPDRHFTTDFTDTPAYATNEYPFAPDVDPGYHGGVQSQEYLANRYVDIIRNKFNIHD